LLKEEFAVVQAYRQHLWAELIIKDPRWYEQHIYERFSVHCSSFMSHIISINQIINENQVIQLFVGGLMSYLRFFVFACI
jgi:hypothetical protein